MSYRDFERFSPQRIKYAYVTGGAADAQLTCAAADGTTIKTTDIITSAEIVASGYQSDEPDDLIDEVSIPATGKVAFDTTATTGFKVRVAWYVVL